MLFPWMPLASRRLNKEQGGPFATRRLAGPFPKLSTQKGARFCGWLSSLFFLSLMGCVFKPAHLFQWVVRTFVGVCVYIVFRKKNY